jgi:hypothetical protein
MAAVDNIHPTQFGDVTLSHNPDANVGGYAAHTITATLGEHKVGQLKWRKSTGEIHAIDVGNQIRHQGIATAMYNMGKSIPGKGPTHSDDRTDAGEGWAKAVGGRRPKRLGTIG